MKRKTWLTIAFIAMLLGAPNAMFMRVAVLELDPYLLNVLRAGIGALLTLPLIWSVRHAFTRKSMRPVVLASLSAAIASVLYTLAIKYSSASYVSVLFLLSPVLFVIYSSRITKERINQRAIAGITLAAAGASVAVLLPLSLQSGDALQFFPLATALTIVNVIIYPLAAIESKVANEQHNIPMMPLIGVTLWITALCNLVLWGITGFPLPNNLSTAAFWGVLYGAIPVLFLSRLLTIVSYEHIGSAVISALTYFESILAVVLPVIFLDETLSPYVVIGGSLILLSVFVIEYHRSSHHKHHHILRHH